MNAHEATGGGDPKQHGPGGDAIRPCFFDSAGAQLYACHHYPAAPAQGAAALVICNATLHEYERTHRATRQLAIQAARHGHHAMRFDYFATGDSAGDCAEASSARWLEDVAAALAECRRVSKAARICLFGLRLGANLAFRAAATDGRVDTLMLYAPILDVPALLCEWGNLADPVARRHGSASRAGQDHTEMLGFPFTPELRAELLGLAPATPSPALRRVLMFAEDAGSGVAEFASRLRSDGVEVTQKDVKEARIWQHDPMEAMVPIKQIRQMLAWLDQAD